MPDIVTGKVFVDGEKGITATKMNQIISQAVIQPSFITGQPVSSTLDPTDQLIVVKNTGAYANVTGQNLGNSVATSPSITLMRLRSFNAVGNPNFEIDQRTVGAGPATATSFAQDRWYYNKVGTMTFSVSARQDASASPILVPGTNFAISQNFFRFTLGTQEATLGATDTVGIYQYPEGPQLRELISDVHSVSVLIRTSVAGLKFGVTLQDPTNAHSLTKLATISSSNTWTLIPLPNIPVWTASGTWNIKPGNIGYIFAIILGAGSSLTAPANDTWQNGNFVGAVGQSNFAANPVGSTFDIAFVQHEPGAVCTTPIDKPFMQNLDECLRYYQKTYPYGTIAGTATVTGMRAWVTAITNAYAWGPTSFHKPMAKVPTVTLYNHNSGAANSVRDAGNVDHTGAAAGAVGDSGFSYIGFTTATTTGMAVNGQFIADTGW